MNTVHFVWLPVHMHMCATLWSQYRSSTRQYTGQKHCCCGVHICTTSIPQIKGKTVHNISHIPLAQSTNKIYTVPLWDICTVRIIHQKQFDFIFVNNIVKEIWLVSINTSFLESFHVKLQLLLINWIPQSQFVGGRIKSCNHSLLGSYIREGYDNVRFCNWLSLLAKAEHII